MEPLYLKSEDSVYAYLKKFLMEHPHAVQLDGSTTKKKNSNVVLVFQYSLTGEKYKLSGDLTRKAAETFIRLTEEHGSSAVILKEYEEGKERGLILATSKKPDGWNCKLYTKKSSDRLNKDFSDSDY